MKNIEDEDWEKNMKNIGDEDWENTLLRREQDQDHKVGRLLRKVLNESGLSEYKIFRGIIEKWLIGYYYSRYGGQFTVFKKTFLTIRHLIKLDIVYGIYGDKGNRDRIKIYCSKKVYNKIKPNLNELETMFKEVIYENKSPSENNSFY